MNFGDSWRIGLGFMVWASIIAARAIYTHPYEPLWFVGNVASGLAAATAGIMWQRRQPLRDALRRKRNEGSR